MSMALFLKYYLGAIVCLLHLTSVAFSSITEEEWLEDYAEQYVSVMQNLTDISWKYETDMSDENQAALVAAEMMVNNFRKEVTDNATRLFNLSTIKNATSKRALELITNIGTSASPNKTKLEEIANIVARMAKVYSSATVDLNGKQVPLQPYGLSGIMATSRDYDELKNVWKSWRNVSGRVVRKDFMNWVKLSDEAILDGKRYKDVGEYWRSSYGSNITKIVDNLLVQIMPLYKLFHAYVRDRLKKQYGKEHFPKSGTIPAHLLGNMWAQEWNNIKDIVLPSDLSFDVTDSLKSQNYTPKTMFKLSEKFFVSLGLKPMTDSFWNRSIFIKLPNKTMVCHASAWEFFKKDDYRIKMCTEITMEDLVTIHHEMGHVEYYLQYADQPVYFRDGANPGFHEAVGDTLALSVATPQHLKKINLLTDFEQTTASSLNFLMMGALEKLVFLPFSYIADTYRWKLFSGEIPTSEYNAAWWKMRCEHQGLNPPVHRSEEDFDPGSKMHIANAIPYIRYFVSHIVQFQFHEALCKAANFTGSLHQCDIYESKEAGKKLEAMLKLGSSLPWEDALEQITGSRTIDATAMVNYFKPLETWLRANVKKDTIGWECTKPDVSSSPKTTVEFLLLLFTIYLSFSFIDNS